MLQRRRRTLISNSIWKLLEQKLPSNQIMRLPVISETCQSLSSLYAGHGGRAVNIMVIFDKWKSINVYSPELEHQITPLGKEAPESPQIWFRYDCSGITAKPLCTGKHWSAFPRSYVLIYFVNSALCSVLYLQLFISTPFFAVINKWSYFPCGWNVPWPNQAIANKS